MNQLLNFKVSKKNRRNTLILLGIGLIPIGLLGILRNGELKEATALDTCLPDGMSRTKIATSGEYDLWKIGHSKHARNYLTRIDGGECTVINRVPGHPNNDYPLLTFIDEAAAVELRRQQFSTIIDEMGGIEMYQAMMDKNLKGERGFMPLETYLALEDLGVVIPAGIEKVSRIPSVEEMNEAQTAQLRKDYPEKK